MLNKVMLIGNVGRNPDYTRWDNGGSLAVTTLATTEREFTTKDGRRIPERTEWHNIVFRNQLAEIVNKYVHTGDRIYVEGKLTTRSYDDAEGVKRTVTEIQVHNLVLLSSKPKETPVEEDIFR